MFTNPRATATERLQNLACHFNFDLDRARINNPCGNDDALLALFKGRLESIYFHVFGTHIDEVENPE